MPSRPRIRPLLAANCYACHGESAMGGLRLDTREGFFKGSDAGPIVEPGKPEASTLLRWCSTPPAIPRCRKGRAKLAPGRHRRADRVGARRRGRGRRRPPPPPTPVASHAKAITAEQRAFWSFAPLADAPPPAVRDSGVAATDIDRFILARLEARGPAPVGDADKRTLLRRVTLDLTGLPPTPEEVDAFLADTSPDGVRKGRRSAARVAALRRGVGPHVARRRALRRRRLPQPRPDGPRLQPVSQRATSIATGSSAPSTTTCPTTSS